MRILIVTKGLDLGGLERVVADLAVGLHRGGVNVEVAVVNDRRDAFIPRLAGAGIVVHRLGGSDRIGVRAAARLRRLVNDGDVDVVHVHGPFVAAVVRLLGPHHRIVTTSHTPWGSLRPATRMLWRATRRTDAATIAVSSAVASSLPIPTEQVIVIAHGVDLDQMRQVRAAQASRGSARSLTNDDGRVRVLAVASHREAKNQPNLLRAFRHAVDLGASIRLAVVGDGPDLERHRELAAELGLDAVVEFLPATDDIDAVIAAADLLVVSSNAEGQPLVVSEALALGTPVVATDVGLVTEIVDDSVGRVVAPGDPVKLGQAIAEVAMSSALRQRLVSAAIERPTMRTLSDAIDDHLKVYRSVLMAADGETCGPDSSESQDRMER